MLRVSAVPDGTSRVAEVESGSSDITLEIPYEEFDRLKATLTNTGRTFYQGVPMDLSLTDSWGPALQLGMSYRITKQWSLNAQVASAVVETKLRVRGGGGEHQATFEFTPTVWMATVGYSF